MLAISVAHLRYFTNPFRRARNILFGRRREPGEQATPKLRDASGELG